MTYASFFIQVLDNICLQPLAKDVLNFIHQRHMIFLYPAKIITSIIKSWETFEIFLHGTMLELIQLYIEDTSGERTSNGFLFWQ